MHGVRSPLSGSLRKDGRWRIVVTLTRADGAKIKKAVHAPTQRECQAAARKLIGTNEKRAYKDARSITQAWETWEEEAWERLSPGSIRQHSWAKKRIIAEFGAKDVTHVDAGSVLRWLRKLLASPALSGNSPKHLKSSLSSLLSFCQECGWIATNPARDVRMPVGARKNPPRPRMSDATLALVVSKEPDPILADLWETLGQSGLRPGEALRLTSSDLPYQSDMWWLKVRRSKTAAGEGREVPLPDPLAHRLLEREGALFPGWTKGTHSQYRELTRKWAEALDRAEIARTNLYQLRKLAISRWIAAGMPDDVVKELAGHSSIRLTKDWYNQVGKARLSECVFGRIGQSVGRGVGQ